MDLTEEIRQRINELNGGNAPFLAMGAVRGVSKWPTGQYYYNDAFVAVTSVDLAIFEAKETGTFRKRVEVRASSRYPLRELRSVGVDRNTEALCFEHDPQEFWLLPLGPKEAWAHFMRTLAEAHEGTQQTSAPQSRLQPERKRPLTTWSQLEDYIRATYTLQDSEPGFLTLVLNVGDGRTQLVVVLRQTLMDGQEEWVSIVSPIGPLAEIDLRRAFDEVGPKVAGALTVAGDKLFLKHSAPIAGLDVNSFERPMWLIAASADELEATLIGGDVL